MGAPTDSRAFREHIDPLFALPLDAFTATRNQVAASLKKAGQSDAADAVRRIPKPPASAWAVNQLYWQHRAELDALLLAGDRFREAQRAQIAGQPSDVTGTLDARRAALRSAEARALGLLAEAGQAPTDAVARRVATTLDALATYGTLPGAPPAGRLTADLDPPGFDALAALLPPQGSGRDQPSSPRVLPFSRERARSHTHGRAGEPAAERLAREAADEAAARAALTRAEQTARDARARARELEAELRKAASRVKTAERARKDAEQRIEDAVREHDEASREARRISRDAEAAAQAVHEAELALERLKLTTPAARKS